MREVAHQVGFDPRQVLKVLRLAVAPVEPGENAENLGRALRAENRVGLGKACHVEIRDRRLAHSRIGAE